jgi:hypothetical protein
MKHEVDELRDLDVVDSDLGLALRTAMPFKKDRRVVIGV